MGEGNSIINLGELSKPATVLIEKVSGAVGGLCKPWQTKRVAKAEGEAEIIRATTQIEITEFQKRAVARFIAEEGVKQGNMEGITQKALPELDDSSKPEEMQDDWIANFFDKCRIVSDEEMQTLWGKVLAGEANSPGSFSKRTVNFLGSLDKVDARFFTKLCRFCWYIGDATPVVYDTEATIYNEAGINFGMLKHLDEIGLVSFSSLTGFTRRGFGKRYKVTYHGERIIIEFKKDDANEIDVGKVLLSKTGLELARMCDANPVEGFMEYVLDFWVKQGVSVACPYPRFGP